MKDAVRVLFICTGNTCRSPMAEAIFRDMVKKDEENLNLLGVNIMCQSAGLGARNGDKVSVNSVLAMAEYGIDISKHTARRLTEPEIPLWDIYFVMNETQAYILEQAGVEKDKIYVVSVPDPYGGSLDDYRQTRDKLIEEINRFYIIVKNRLSQI